MASVESIVNSYYQGLKSHNLGGVPFDTALQFEGPFMKTRGASAFVEAASKLFPITKDVRVRRRIIDGEHACILWDLETNTPAGTLPICDYLRIEGGTIKEIRAYYDPGPLAKVMAQMGG